MSKSEVEEWTSELPAVWHLESVAMRIITLRLGDDERLDVPSVITALHAEFAGTTITEYDSFEAERRRANASIAGLARESTPIKNPQRILERITNKEITMGPGMDISVPVRASLWKGHVWAKSISLSSDDSLSTVEVERLMAFLTSLGVGSIVVVDC